VHLRLERAWSVLSFMIVSFSDATRPDVTNEAVLDHRRLARRDDDAERRPVSDVQLASVGIRASACC
jgi:hypothetical protein